MAEPALRRLTSADYLALEQATGIKHEYKDGYAVAMAGGSIAPADLGGWTMRGYGPGEVSALDSIAVTVPVDTLYEGVELDPGERLRRA